MSMPPRLFKGFLLGLITALCGTALYLMSPLADLETDLGLKLLFELRGPRPAPRNVAVVSIDRQSSRHFGYPNIPRKWPRSRHGELIHKLNQYGARVIVFDVIFSEQRDPQQDQVLADALAAAGNVVLFSYLKREPAQIPNAQGEMSEVLMETLVPPQSQFAQAAAAYGPFPLPKVPARVNQAWLFKTKAGDLPTLPAIALHYFALPVHGQFKQILHSRYSDTTYIDKLFQQIDHKGPDMSRSVRQLRQFVQQHPLPQLPVQNESLQTSSIDYSDADVLLKALLAMYQGSDSRYIDFYGPPQSITTIPYYQIIHPDQPGGSTAIPDLRDKVVFVGFSEQFQSEQKDSFYTVFSQKTGVDISGVEIAATVFANLLENRSIEPLMRPYDLILIFLWGLLAGVVFYLLPGVVSVLATGVLGLMYTAVADACFTHNSLWLPMMHPLFFQLPFALLSTLLWRYLETSKERQTIVQGAGYYLPGRVVDSLSKWDQANLYAGKMVEGVCMATDAERYVTLSEAMEPGPLRHLLNRYYDLLFKPVNSCGGYVIDVVGDAILAVWIDETGFLDRRHSACQAALEIQYKLTIANQSQDDKPGLPTRIGLHCGEMIIGNVGADNRFEYRAVGDTINTVNRIEGLNKYLGTRILASAQVINGLDNMLTRPMGRFRLKGKKNWIEVYELMSIFEYATESILELSAQFNDALCQFQSQDWQQAQSAFELILQHHGADGPSQYYLQYCQRYLREGSPEHWDGVISLADK